MAKIKIGDKVLVHLTVVDIFNDGKTCRVAEEGSLYATGINVKIGNVTCVTDNAEAKNDAG